MGIDVNLYAEGDVTDDELAAANTYLIARCDIADEWDKTGSVLARVNHEWLPRPRIELKTMVRYYGECYERGPWPNIYGAIRLMQTALPQCRVFYGGDTSAEGIECSEEYLAELWEHFLGPHGDDYHESNRKLNEEYAQAPRTDRRTT